MWYDRDVKAGVEWAAEIKEHLNTAQIILLLVSPDFIDSDYCYSVEMERAMERHERGEAHVIPVILRPALWEGTPFGKLLALPTDGKPVTFWHNQEEGFFDVTKGIQDVVKELLLIESNEYYKAESNEKSYRTLKRIIRFDLSDARLRKRKGDLL